MLLSLVLALALHPAFAVDADFEDALPVELAPAQVKAGTATIKLFLEFPEGWHLNPQAPLRWALKGGKTMTVRKPKPPLTLRFKATGKQELQLFVNLAYCRDDGKGVCKMKTVLLKQPIETSERATNVIAIHYKTE